MIQTALSPAVSSANDPPSMRRNASRGRKFSERSNHPSFSSSSLCSLLAAQFCLVSHSSCPPSSGSSAFHPLAHSFSALGPSQLAFYVRIFVSHEETSIPSLTLNYDHIIVSMASAWYSDVYNTRGIPMIGASIISIIGWAMFLGQSPSLFT